MLYHFSLYAWESQAPFDSTDCFVVEAWYEDWWKRKWVDDQLDILDPDEPRTDDHTQKLHSLIGFM
jgi:hypothetical protein